MSAACWSARSAPPSRGHHHPGRSRALDGARRGPSRAAGGPRLLARNEGLTLGVGPADWSLSDEPDDDRRRRSDEADDGADDGAPGDTQAFAAVDDEDMLSGLEGVPTVDPDERTDEQAAGVDEPRRHGAGDGARWPALLALILALTVGLFGIHDDIGFTLVPTTLVVESVGIVILAITLAMVMRSQRAR